VTAEPNKNEKAMVYLFKNGACAEFRIHQAEPKPVESVTKAKRTIRSWRAPG
jgi:hypothetical protein